MSRYSTSEISIIVNGKLIGDKAIAIDSLVFDSRKLFDTTKTLFIAIIGKRHNGHSYISNMYNKGVRIFLISDTNFNLLPYSKATFIIVQNTVLALQQLTAHYRKSFNIPIIGITGSNGKTIVKEWLSTCMTTKHNITRSPKSYNSQVGVPLSVWLLNKESTWGIFEAGISQANEMQNLAKIIAPSHGIITNLGEAHQQGFNSLKEKLEEKLILFKNCDSIYYCLDHELIHKALCSSTKYNSKTLITWSYNNSDASLFIEDKKQENSITKLRITYNNQHFTLKVPFIDNASVENAIHVVNFLLANNYSISEVQVAINKLYPVAMRMEQIQGINSCTLINDSYNSDINSVSIAIEYMNQQLHSDNVLVLSDIQQSGIPKEELYSKVAKLILQGRIKLLIAIGSEISLCKKLFPSVTSYFYANTKEFIDSEKWKTFKNRLILIKGARGFQFEKIVSILSAKNHTTILEANLNILTDNLNYFRSLLSADTRIMVMVKALAYGSGISEIASLLQHEKIDYLGVAFTDEGVQLRKTDINLPIMVMAPDTDDFNRIVEFELEPEIYSFRVLKKFIAFTKSQQINKYPIHIKIDTGMHRLGFLVEEIPELLNILSTIDTVKVKGIFSHLAASDDSKHDDFSHQQIHSFNIIVNSFEHKLKYKPIRHILNSAGIERFPEAHFEMVRLGIGLHGISIKNTNLLPVSTLKTHVAQIKNIAIGETIGYSRRGKADKNKRIAIIPIGYADGLDRKLGNGNAYVTIKGNKAPYIGSICMDMSMIDISNIDCCEGDEVVVFGENPSVNELANKIDTIPYEILTNISSRVKRIYLKE